MKRAREIYRDENKNNAFNHEDAWAILQKHAKWDAPDPAPIDLTEEEHVPSVNTEELFGPDARPRPPGKERPGKKTNPIHRSGKQGGCVGTGSGRPDGFEPAVIIGISVVTPSTTCVFGKVSPLSMTSNIA
nr:hypothetical protein [Tanacetum cinerariifolium]